MSKRLVFRVAGIAGGCLVVLATGCQWLPFVSNDERVQISYVRSFKNALSPNYNKSLGVMAREVGSLMAYGIPTKYGLDLGAYLGAFPEATPIPPTVSALPTGDTGTHELKAIQDTGGQLRIGFNTVFLTPTGNSQTASYSCQIYSTPTRTTGTVNVLTTGSNWMAPPGGSAGYVLGQGKTPQVASSMTINGTLFLPGSVGANIQASLGPFDQSGSAPVPRNATVNFTLQNSINANLSGTFSSPQAVLLNGTVTLKGDKGNETYQTQISATGGTVKGTFLNDARHIKIDLSFDQGLLTGTAKATDGRQAELAKFVHQAGKSPEVDYADGTHEIWNFTLPPT